ncbi:hypothetical protein HMPREF3052_09815 [Neisseria sp. HMSC056A03]|uniref:hypothetical protein n=1 Tax=Neisseria sp. HMSC056A03 TaxID=1739544 RepID=UPI0008A1735A|nr:hypothetical protein [Neisseria sp. HMSC056A03]OFO26598.1 hypothetical protein HMPREF3052_09815 [Neisseria sp. HMSC056A03]
MSRFTGGDHLKPEDGLKYYIHQAMMVNELSGGHGAYKISNAEKASSGPSFGPIQYDIGSNVKGQKLLEQIAREATDSKGNRFISDNEIKQMQIHLYKPFNKMSAEDKQVYQNLKPKLNQALASEAGISLINQNYDKVLDKKVKDVNQVISDIKNNENKKFLQSNMQAQVFIADIGNQYGGKVNRALEEFLSQSKEDNGVRLPGGRQVKVEGKLDMEDLKNFRMNTAYGVKHPADARRRDKHIEDVTAPTREKPRTQTDKFHALVQGLLNDKDGSFAKQVLAENREVVDAFNAKVQERMEQERQQTAAREISVQQNPAEREFGGRSFG